MTEDKASTPVTIRLSAANLRGVEAVCALEHIDRSKLLEELIEEGLCDRTIRLYEAGKLTVGKGAEILGISQREFFELLENKFICLNWDSAGLKEYMKQISKRKEASMSEPYKEGELKPKRCPNCGSENIHNQELEARSDSSELYDTYCRDCKWSGDISPDKHLE
jgi:predicted HTH domain antitoxin